MKTRWIRSALVAAACLAGAVQAQTVTPPPLPIGSLEARPEPGMSEPERKRAERAHHHKLHHKKDKSHDDSLHTHGPAAVQPVGTAAGTGAASNMGSGGAAAVQGGPGTGPARVKTDKGASSYFFGDDKKPKQ
jgi:hypothetical protein